MLGCLDKMITELTRPVTYSLPLSDQRVALNPLLGRELTLTHTGQIFCVHCRRKTRKSFNQGYCYPCFVSLAQCDRCIMKPELCHFHHGTCREPSWGEAFCFQPHFVYLANSSGVKVGITRQTQIPTRWIDQGAEQALPIMKVTSRHVSGLVEVAIAKHVSDKTSWQRMLKNRIEPLDLKAFRDRLLRQCAADLEEIGRLDDGAAIEFLPDAEIVDIEFPVAVFPNKVKSCNFDKQPVVSGVLQGIKGQYLIFDSGVINIRKFSGYEIAFQS